MATVSGSIVLYEQMTAPMQNIIRSMHMVITSMEEVKIAGKTAFNPTSIASARQMLNQADIEIQKIVADTNKASQAQSKYNNEVGKGKTELTGMNTLMGKMAGIAATAFSAKQVLSVADGYTQSYARLIMINDGLQSQKELQDRIFASAERSRTTYGAITPIISKLGVLAGEAFNSNKEMVYFAELMNKNFVIGGASAQEQSAAMYQLTQAMAAGRLQGDEFRSIMENAPLLAQNIAKEMNVPMGQLRDMSREGLITADIIKAAMLNNASEIEAAYEKMPYTWAQVWTMIVNEAYQNFAPLIEWIGSGAQFVYDNWIAIEPLFYGLAVSAGIYTVAIGLATLKTLLLNKALLSSPIGWAALGIGMMVANIVEYSDSIGGLNILWLETKNNVLTCIEDIQNRWNGFWAGFDRLIVESTIKLRNFFSFTEQAKEDAQVYNNADLVYLKQSEDKLARNTAQRAENQAKRNVEYELAKVQAFAKKAEKEMIPSWDTIPQIRDMTKYTSETASNTSEIKDSLKASVDELKLLREVAARKAIAEYTTREVKLDMSNMEVHLQNETDYDGWIGKLSKDLQEVMAISGEGLYV